MTTYDEGSVGNVCIRVTRVYKLFYEFKTEFR